MGVAQTASEVFNAGAEADSASEAIDMGLETGETELAESGHHKASGFAGLAKATRMNAGSGLMDRVIGAGFAFVIGVIMLNFLFGIDLVANSSGPFSSQLTTIEEVIGAAIVLGALGILALAGYYARSMMGGM
jgi:hypothetical protein